MSSSTNEVNIWSRFERKLQGGETVRLKIQDVPKGHEMEVAEFMMTLFAHEDVFNKASGISNNPSALEEGKILLRDIVDEFPALVCCIDSDTDTQEDTSFELVGCNVMLMSKKGEHLDFKVESEELKKLLKLAKHTDKFNTIFEKYGITEYLSGADLSVHPKYRGCGIAVELLKARRPLCEHLGIGVTAAMFTGVASQRAAARAGYELVAEVDYNSFGELCGVTFQNDAPSFKFFAMKI